MDLVLIDINDPESIYFECACLYQILYKPMMVTAYIAVQTFPWAFLSFAITQLDILIYNLENMKELIKERRAEKNCSEDEAFQEIFTGCVLHHRAIISFLDTVEAAFRSQFALTLLFNGCIICCTGVQLFSIQSLTKDFVDVLWVLAYLQIFIMIQFGDCYFGNTVYRKSTEVATVAFGCPWLTLSTESKRNLIVFIARAQKPLLITAYNLVPITLLTFTRVMNWTYKAFAVMNEMKK
ncbi:odorant receptor 49b-like [Choristoneura fumiferana]|uniref:odorant receptor 49b-like n=1 Tax=Choristoneura fumiferana TaxID=7141 RepID=UPI003D15B1EF